jgi:hypothetical protein
MKKAIEFLNPFRPMRSFSQAAWQLVAGLSAGFLLVHALGWREDVSFISGTVGAHGALLTACFGTLYLMFYFAFTLAVPVLLLALFIFNTGRWLAGRCSGKIASGPEG